MLTGFVKRGTRQKIDKFDKFIENSYFGETLFGIWILRYNL